MADTLSGIFGTEKDKVNCPFYFKIGACRHGDKCSRKHHKPERSQTLLIPHLYQNPMIGIQPDEAENMRRNPAIAEKLAEDFELFFYDMYKELAKFGKVDELNICDNLGDHLVGNIYVKFAEEDDAVSAKEALEGRFYAGKPVVPEFSPVTDFRDACCRQFDANACTRGGYCNFMHLKPISRELQKELFGTTRRRFEDEDDRHRERDSYRDRDRDRDRHRDRDRDNDRDRDRPRERDRDRERGDRERDRDRDRDRGDRDRDRGDRDRDRGDRDRDRNRDRDRDRDPRRRQDEPFEPMPNIDPYNPIPAQYPYYPQASQEPSRVVDPRVRY